MIIVWSLVSRLWNKAISACLTSHVSSKRLKTSMKERSRRRTPISTRSLLLSTIKLSIVCRKHVRSIWTQMIPEVNLLHNRQWKTNSLIHNPILRVRAGLDRMTIWKIYNLQRPKTEVSPKKLIQRPISRETNSRTWTSKLRRISLLIKESLQIHHLNNFNKCTARAILITVARIAPQSWLETSTFNPKLSIECQKKSHLNPSSQRSQAWISMWMRRLLMLLMFNNLQASSLRPPKFIHSH